MLTTTRVLPSPYSRAATRLPSTRWCSSTSGSGGIGEVDPREMGTGADGRARRDPEGGVDEGVPAVAALLPEHERGVADQQHLVTVQPGTGQSQPREPARLRPGDVVDHEVPVAHPDEDLAVGLAQVGLLDPGLLHVGAGGAVGDGVGVRGERSGVAGGEVGLVEPPRPHPRQGGVDIGLSQRVTVGVRRQRGRDGLEGGGGGAGAGGCTGGARPHRQGCGDPGGDRNDGGLLKVVSHPGRTVKGANRFPDAVSRLAELAS